MAAAPPLDVVKAKAVVANDAVHQYWAIVRGSGPADLSALFSPTKGRWISAGAKVRGKKLLAVTDTITPLASSLSEEPEIFMMAADGLSARGLWYLKDASGVQVAWYAADWRSIDGKWELTDFYVQRKTGPNPPVEPYCHVPNDGSYVRDIPRPNDAPSRQH